ncbi:MAG: CopD family protein, partial [Clostridia bacterium]|nr:CopD family protein [Clostridia bacterium]
GVYMAALRLYGVLALVEHRYGLTLLIKLVFLSGVLALAGLNLWVVRPRLNSGSGGKTRAAWLLRRFVAGEAALGLAVLAAAGALSTTAPPIGEPLRVSVTLSADPIAPQTAPQTLAIPVNKPIRLTATNAGSTTHACVVWKFPHDVIDGGHNRVAGQDMHIIREARAPGNRHVPGPTPWTVHGLLHGGRPLLRLAAVPLISRRTAPTAASVPHAVAP